MDGGSVHGLSTQIGFGIEVVDKDSVGQNGWCVKRQLFQPVVASVRHTRSCNCKLRAGLDTFGEKRYRPF